MKEEDIVQWIENWFLSQCNGDWEHSEGIRIETLDNPGWHIRINLEGTNLQEIEYNSGLIEKNENDWYCITVKDGIYEANGDPNKLNYLLNNFMNFVLKNK